ncbi:DNA-binding protein, partial [Staphylococcus equorum]
MLNKERNKIIAKNIKKYLKQTNMSQKELANKISISPSTLSDYLNLRSNPSHGVIQKISDEFGILKSDIDTTYKESNDISDIYNKLST